MLRLLLLALAILPCSFGQRAVFINLLGSQSILGPLFVKSNGATGSTVTLSSVLAGHGLFVGVASDGTGGTTTGCSDGGDTFTQVALSPATANVATNFVSGWVAFSVSAGSKTIACTGAGASSKTFVAEFSGGTSVDISFALNNDASPVGPISVGPMTITVPNTLLFLVGIGGGGTTGTCTSWTEDQRINGTAGNNLSHINISASGAYTATGCPNANSFFTAYFMAAIK